MSRKSTALLIALLLLTFLGTGLKCGGSAPKTPGAPVGPANAWQYASVEVKLFTTAPGDKDVRYVVDWGDGVTDTSTAKSSNDTAKVYHAWQQSGQFQYKALAVLDEDPEKASEFSDPASITIDPNSPPSAPRILGPLVAVKGFYAFFTASATDPDNDSLQFKFDFANNWTTPLVASGIGAAEDSNKWSRLDTVWVKCEARDQKGGVGPKDSIEVIVGAAGAPIWYWMTPDEDSVPPNCSPLVAVSIDDGREYVYVGADDELGKFYRVDPRKGRTSGNKNGMVTEEYFTGHPAFCDATKHVIVGNQEGELHAFDTELSRDWHYPGNTNEENIDYREWGTPAISGSYIYVTRDDSLRGGAFANILYRIRDQGSQASEEGQYGFTKTILDAPVIDNTGNVLLGTDAGTLVKMPPDISGITWEIVLDSAHDVHAPAIGSNGTIYCGTSGTLTPGKLIAVRPDSAIIRTQILEAEVYQPAISASAVYANTSNGKLYSFSPDLATKYWEKQISASLIGTPILAGADYIYCRSDNDSLYCVNRDSGTVIWGCNCAIRDKASRRGMTVEWPEISLAILSSGHVLVVTGDALFCVAGYEERPLATAPWPKWQHDRHNTGKFSGW